MPTGTGTRAAKTPLTTDTPERKQRGQEKSQEATNLQARIAYRAYQLYEDSGRIPGRDLENWLQAEQELLGDQMGADRG